MNIKNMKDIGIEYGRVTAFKLCRYNKDIDDIEDVYLPQFEVIKYNSIDGKTISSDFAGIPHKLTTSGLVECDSELEALQFAVEYRNNIHKLQNQEEE